jgi:hypothetical protein
VNGEPKVIIWIGDGPEKFLGYAAWLKHLRACADCERDGGCPLEAELWALYRRMTGN